MDDYIALERVLRDALKQASHGKGNDRHYMGERFEDQKIMVIARWVSGGLAAGPLQQAIKKCAESVAIEKFDRFNGIHRAIDELRGAINYIAAAILILEEKKVYATTQYCSEVVVPIKHECNCESPCLNCSCQQAAPPFDECPTMDDCLIFDACEDGTCDCIKKFNPNKPG